MEHTGYWLYEEGEDTAQWMKLVSEKPVNYQPGYKPYKINLLKEYR